MSIYIALSQRKGHQLSEGQKEGRMFKSDALLIEVIIRE